MILALYLSLRVLFLSYTSNWKGNVLLTILSLRSLHIFQKLVLLCFFLSSGLWWIEKKHVILQHIHLVLVLRCYSSLLWFLRLNWKPRAIHCLFLKTKIVKLQLWPTSIFLQCMWYFLIRDTLQNCLTFSIYHSVPSLQSSAMNGLSDTSRYLILWKCQLLVVRLISFTYQHVFKMEAENEVCTVKVGAGS